MSTADMCMGWRRPASRELVRHAERFGTDEVYATACVCKLATEELARVSARLRRINPCWRPPFTERNRLAEELDMLGWPILLIQAATGLSKSRFYELRREWRARASETASKAR